MTHMSGYRKEYMYIIFDIFICKITDSGKVIKTNNEKNGSVPLKLHIYGHVIL